MKIRTFHNTVFALASLTALGATLPVAFAQTPSPSPAPAKPKRSHSIVHRIKKSKPAAAATPAATEGQVWVNTKTGVYHMPGTRWYGRTAQGEYMTAAEAQAKGYREAENGQ